MGKLLYASEAWLLSILGWVWLTVQEMFAVTLLGSLVYYGMVFVSTCHIVLVALYSNERSIHSAYFSIVLVLLIVSVVCIFDTLEVPTLGSSKFELSVVNGTYCSLAKVNRAFFFGGTPLFLVQGGVIMGYMIVHVFIAAAGLGAGDDSVSLWTGPAWGLALIVLTSFRFFLAFEGTSKKARSIFRYVHLFSEPVLALSSSFLFAFEAGMVVLALEGFPLPKLGQRKFVRFFSLGFTLLFVIGAGVTLSFRGMLTIPTLTSLLLTCLPAVAGALEANSVSAPVTETHAPPSARSVYNRVGARPVRQCIPVPVEMIAEKSKGV
jgi:hypothetical protein